MLDFSRLRTPPGDGDVLIEPPAGNFQSLTDANASLLRSYDFKVLDASIGDWRGKLRASMNVNSQAPVVITGHQPDFIHAGVWAKHVVASAFARSVGGAALNIVVDSDAPTAAVLETPTVGANGVTVQSVPYAVAPRGIAHECFPAMPPDAIDKFDRCVRDLLATHYEVSCLPEYFSSLRESRGSRDWVDQAVHARSAVDRLFGVELIEHRAGRTWFGPLLADLLLNAERFRDCYNHALAAYRVEHRVRSPNRPIPDLACDGDRCESPVWVYRMGQPRRRLLVEHSGDRLLLYADTERIGQVSIDQLRRWETAGEALSHLDGYVFRPRALSLTLWARVFVGDLFIHGIGGAKYDRITDDIIRRYYAVEPPGMACVSATLRLDLVHDDVNDDSLRSARAALRDLRFNPHRHVPAATDTAALIERRRLAAIQAMEQKAGRSPDRAARRDAFRRIRDLNAELLARNPSMTTDAERRITEMAERLDHARLARRRDYFFAMIPRTKLAALRDRLSEMVLGRT